MKFSNKILFAGIWNLFERFYNQLVRFVLNILLARILFPSDYGKLGMVMIFVVISQSFIEGGFINALIQKQNRNEEDFSVTFYFNIFVAVFFYIILFFTSPLISSFYNTYDLTIIIRFISISIIFDSLTVVPRSIIAINLEYKKQAKSNAIAITISGIISIVLANYGFGVWALVIQSISLSFINSVFLLLYVNWRPKLRFSFLSFKGLFSFGSKLLFVNLLDRIFKNLHYLIIGKFYSVDQLGFYSRADQFTQLPASNIAGMIQSVTFPRMCEEQDNLISLKNIFVKNINIASLVSFPVFLFIFFFSESIIILFLTNKWIEVSKILSILSLSGLLYAINFLNINVLLAIKKSNQFLWIESFKKIIMIIILLYTVKMGVMAIVYGQVFFGLISFYINSYFTSKYINFTILDQVKEIFPNLLLSFAVMFLSNFISDFFLHPFIKLIFGFLFSFLFYFIIIYFFNFKDYKSLIKFNKI